MGLTFIAICLICCSSMGDSVIGYCCKKNSSIEVNSVDATLSLKGSGRNESTARFQQTVSNTKP